MGCEDGGTPVQLQRRISGWPGVGAGGTPGVILNKPPFEGDSYLRALAGRLLPPLGTRSGDVNGCGSQSGGEGGQPRAKEPGGIVIRLGLENSIHKTEKGGGQRRR